jgi:hypothetical protein
MVRRNRVAYVLEDEFFLRVGGEVTRSNVI